jgi:regulator of sirC expression with transglutaminase-like and TPR domain
VTAPTDFVPPETTPLGQLLSNEPISRDIQNRAQQKLTDLYTKMQAAYRQAQGAYQKLTALAPEDPSLQLQLADVAVNSGDVGAALTAYRRFLKLAPDDPSAPLVKQEIKRLEKELSAAGG